MDLAQDLRDRLVLKGHRGVPDGSEDLGRQDLVQGRERLV